MAFSSLFNFLAKCEIQNIRFCINELIRQVKRVQKVTSYVGKFHFCKKSPKTVIFFKEAHTPPSMCMGSNNGPITCCT